MIFQMIYTICLLLRITVACSDSGSVNESVVPLAYEINLVEQNLLRAVELTDAAVASYFIGKDMVMARYYNPFTGGLSEEKGSIWMYTSAIEAVNAILHALKAQKASGNSTLYDVNFKRYADLLYKLYEKADYYLGTFELVSYAQTKEWTVYGVNRGTSEGQAEVAGIMNVYDDQMWLVREFIEAYQINRERRIPSESRISDSVCARRMGLHF